MLGHYVSMTDLHISWDNYHHSIEYLAAQIYQSQWNFNQIVCLAKGGLRIGDILARIFDVPLAILSVSSYGGDNFQTRGSTKFAKDLTMTTPTLGSHLLVVDDLVDSGLTLEQSLAWLDQHYGSSIQEHRTAVLWWKDCSVIDPHYYVQYLQDNPWIHQPFEQYETLSAEVFAQQYTTPPKWAIQRQYVDTSQH